MLGRKETDYQRIIRKTGRKPINCKCTLCKLQCKTPCLGTPEDIQRLIDNGYSKQLKYTIWGAGIIAGSLDRPIEMVQAIDTGNGCIFFNNGLCDLHDLGLKPTEGKLSHHSVQLDNYKFSNSLAYNVSKLWEDEDHADLVRNILNQFKD